VRHVHVNGVDLEYVDEGSGVPVVFSHGGSSDIRYWEPQREFFSSRYRFVAYSHRYHGSGPPPARGEYSAEAHVDDLVALISRLGEPAHLVGFSTAIALRTVLRAPDIVRSLTIIEPNIPWLLEGDPEGEAVLAWWRAENQRVLNEAGGDAVRRGALWFELVNNRGPETFEEQPQALRRMWLDNYTATRPAALTPAPLTAGELGTITTPTLALGGEFGMPYSRSILERIARTIGPSHLVIVSGATHFMSYQIPDRFNQEVVDFLDRQ